jgi:two-component system cell cycle sensor histidine kinase/response regulator CckA
VNLHYDPSIHHLQKSLSLHRSLLALIPTPRSEHEVIQLVVDSIYEHFRDYRCSFSLLSKGGIVEILYSRASEGLPSITGKVFDISRIEGLQESFRVGLVSVVPDVRNDLKMAPFAPQLLELGGHISRLDVPVPNYDGRTCILSLTHSSPIHWDSATVELLREVAEPVGLLLRDAGTRGKLQRSEELFREFAENMQAVVWMTAIPENRIVYVSPQYELIWGRSPRHLYDDRISLLETIHPDDRVRVKGALERQAFDSYKQEYRVVRPDGEIRWIRDRGFHVFDADGLVRRVVGIAEDVTPLREAEQRLEASRALVASNAKFAALGEMASGIAHEINNPLAVIHGLAVQLQELFRENQAPSPMVIESLASMEKMSNRIAAIVKGLRTFSRTSAADPMTSANLNAIAQETASMCEPKLKAAGIQFTVSLPSSPVIVRCRPSEISQVILNLVNNSFDAITARGSGWVKLEVQAQRGSAYIVVEDSGAGVVPDSRERIFQPFYTTKEVGKGTGLGLSISKGIVEAHGGVLFLDDTAKITRFIVELPGDSP